MEEKPFQVVAKGRAFDNEVVRRRFTGRREVESFDARADAESFAAHASHAGDRRVVVQAAAPQDPADCDAYLVAIPPRHTQTPVDPEADVWRFHTGANQQGAIGEVLATTPATNPPALTWFVRRDLGDPDGLQVRVDRDVDPVGSWHPDARVVASVDVDRVETYLCEVKTGNASFQRGQRAGMNRAAATGRVLTVRVRVDGLPDEYTVDVTEYAPNASTKNVSGE
jgi:hypothetical protein